MRYILFAGDAYYPGGGVNDIIAVFNDLEYAKEHAEKPRKQPWVDDQVSAYDWANILDAETLHTHRRRNGTEPGTFEWEERKKLGS